MKIKFITPLKIGQNIILETGKSKSDILLKLDLFKHSLSIPINLFLNKYNFLDSNIFLLNTA